MLLAGDEIGRTQQGNNNAYCQDNELTWQSWEIGEEDGQLLEFVRKLIRLRQEHRVFRRRKFFQNRSIRGENVRDIVWLDPAGTQMSDEQWQDGFARSLALVVRHCAGPQLSEPPSVAGTEAAMLRVGGEAGELLLAHMHQRRVVSALDIDFRLILDAGVDHHIEAVALP